MNTHTAMRLSQKIKDKILTAGLSVHALEKKAGLKQSAVQNIIYGKSKKPSLHIIQAIAQVLNCTVTELLEEKDNSYLGEESIEKERATSNFPWLADLFVEALNMIHMLSKKKSLFLSKEQLLSCTEEVYEYSLKNNKSAPDICFADWLIEKSAKA